MSLKTTTGSTVLRAFAGAAALLLAGLPAVQADDRELLRGSVSEPYVFILLDTSGSMHWSPKCTQTQFNNGECDFLCPTGDCFVPRNGDDPNSKFYQAKEALYEVVKDIDSVHFGFATYNQDSSYMRSKHFLYRATNNGPTIPGFGAYPAIGVEEVLGQTWSCTSGASDGCGAGTPADLNDAWERERVRRVPKGGATLADNITLYVRSSGTTYRVIYDPVGGSLGSNVTINVRIDRCTNSSCSNRTYVGDTNVVFEPRGEFAAWDIGVSRTNPQLGYFNQGDTSDPNAANTCSGWDPNTDTTSDRYDGYSIRFPTTTDPRGSYLDLGDVIPLDWTNNRKQDILNRLAPNLVADPSATPDFGTATYFRNTRNSGDDYIRLKTESQRPLFASGSTPLGNSVRSFRQWWAGCTSATCGPGGWEKIAMANDPEFSCRKKFLIVLTDGDESCNGDPCGWTKTLFTQEGIKTYVVAFGIESVAGNKLECMAKDGGSGEPIYPQNKQELIKTLKDLFDEIREEASAFASAAVPSVQAEVADRIFLSSFTPLNNESVWDGHLDAYLKPLPLTADGKPNRARKCSASIRSSCHLWDAGESMETQAVLYDTIKTDNTPTRSELRIGMQPTERRVFYGKAPKTAGIHQGLQLFAPPTNTEASLTDPEWVDLWLGLRIPVDPLDIDEAEKRTREIFKKTFGIKKSTINKATGGTEEVRYILGDIFHSDPSIIDRPSDFSFYSSDLFANTAATTCTNNPGYRCFAEKHQRRRKMLVVGSNDGQLHFFDGGIWDDDLEKFGDGSGKELFSYIPRVGLPIVRDLAEGTRQIFGLDATPRIDDVFLDPDHNGTPTPSQREWRTLVIGGFREGGEVDGKGGNVSDFVSGYYALDITQPDQLNADGEPIDNRIVPSCLSQNNVPVSGCGTMPYPALLWEFTDAVRGSRLDEDDINGDGIADGNGTPDLGQTWSVPTVGRIRVREGTTVTYRFVAIFGGGFDNLNKTSPKRGNWLYMVDIETGQAIYKRQLPGAVPSDPAVLDVDLDGFLDTIYIGTTAGYVYKVDISQPASIRKITISRNLTIPRLATDPEVTRIEGWDPFPIFDTFGKPIYFPPTVFYVAKLGRFALAFGTGDREDLWNESGQEGRFFLVVDDNFTATDPDLPFDETNYRGFAADAAQLAPGTDFVLNPQTGYERGWYIRLPANERVITQTFGLSGILIFSSFQPSLEISGGSAGPICARGGDSHIFVVYANNGNAIMSIDEPDADPNAPDDPNKRSRYRTVPEFVTNPYVEQGSTKNPGGTSTPANSEVLNKTQKDIMESLKQFFPPETKFANYWISVSGIRSDTGYERYATIPIGIVERNWKEH